MRFLSLLALWSLLATFAMCEATDGDGLWFELETATFYTLYELNGKPHHKGNAKHIAHGQPYVELRSAPEGLVAFMRKGVSRREGSATEHSMPIVTFYNTLLSRDFFEEKGYILARRSGVISRELGRLSRVYPESKEALYRLVRLNSRLKFVADDPGELIAVAQQIQRELLGLRQW